MRVTNTSQKRLFLFLFGYRLYATAMPSILQGRSSPLPLLKEKRTLLRPPGR
jgi:hypothetical protein